jgi:phospholipase C
MSTGHDNLEHVVVLMVGKRLFDHMLGTLKSQDAGIDGHLEVSSALTLRTLLTTGPA